MTEREWYYTDAANIVKEVAKLSAPCWCKEDEDTGAVEVCDCCNLLANIDDALKAAGVEE